MSQGVERHCELFFYILAMQKSDLDKLAEVMLQVGK
jgi:hypothetical protein